MAGEYHDWAFDRHRSRCAGCVGWYVVEHTGGPLQTPAFLLAMLSWPEAIIFGSHRGQAPLHFYFFLGSLLIATSLLFFCAVALAVQATRGQRDV
jgi:hypothetical protein